MKESEGAPADLCLTVLRRLDDAGVLRDLVLVGSWCMFFYNRVFAGEAKLSALRTRDMDLLVPRPPRFKRKVMVAELLKDLGFMPDLRGDGCVGLSHPDLIVDFLVAERGKGVERTISVPALGVRAQPLRFLEQLSRDTIVVDHEGIAIRLPHPAAFALHKLIVSGRRGRPEKAGKDLRQGLEILDVLAALGRLDEAKARFAAMPAGWRKMVGAALRSAARSDLAARLS